MARSRLAGSFVLVLFAMVMSACGGPSNDYRNSANVSVTEVVADPSFPQTRFKVVFTNISKAPADMSLSRFVALDKDGNELRVEWERIPCVACSTAPDDDPISWTWRQRIWPGESVHGSIYFGSTVVSQTHSMRVHFDWKDADNPRSHVTFKEQVIEVTR